MSDSELFKEMHDQTNKNKIKKGKEEIRKFLWMKRMNNAHKDESIFSQEIMIQEEKEDIKEEAVLNGKMPLTKHYMYKRVSKKKCWYCKLSNHLRKYCPMIRYFHCQRLEHMKVQCFMYKINKIMKQLKMTIEKKKKRKIEKEKN